MSNHSYMDFQLIWDKRGEQKSIDREGKMYRKKRIHRIKINEIISNLSSLLIRTHGSNRGYGSYKFAT